MTANQLPLVVTNCCNIIINFVNIYVQVILGLPYSMAIDMWSLGCILAELYTGYPLFPGENEVEQLACIIEIFGLPDPALLAEAQRRKLFFGEISLTLLPSFSLSTTSLYMYLFLSLALLLSSACLQTPVVTHAVLLTVKVRSVVLGVKTSVQPSKPATFSSWTLSGGVWFGMQTIAWNLKRRYSMPGYKRYCKSLKNNCVPLSSNVQDTRLKWVWSDMWACI